MPAGLVDNEHACFGVGAVSLTGSAALLSQTILKYEPLALAPYEVAFVQDTSCPAGRVLKVTGAIRGLQRKRACVAQPSTQTSLAVATSP